LSVRPPVKSVPAFHHPIISSLLISSHGTRSRRH
jgi:hypothetical protein